MNEIILASHNENKVREFRQILSSKKIISLNDVGFEKEIEETGFTLEQNALLKVREVFNFSHKTAISDDSGLEIDFLSGEPGVFSARYSGLNARPIDNINKVLKKLGDTLFRNARFRTVIAFKDSNKEKLFEGVVEGKISKKIRGLGGFGYDPIFIPDHFDCTFSEMSTELKNKISHRALAIKKLHRFINSK